MKKAFLFPGRNFQKFDEEIREYLEEKDFETETLQIEWVSNLQENIDRFTAKLEKVKFRDENIFIGFSWGAVAALVNSTSYTTDHLILCSLSPNFKKDYKLMPNSWKLLSGSLRTSLQERPSYSETNTKITFLYGEREIHGRFGLGILGYGGKINEYRLEKYSKSKEVLVENTGHEINSEYREEIKKVVDELEL